jgi:hypothetical protein
MASIQDGDYRSKPAGEDLTGSQYLFVTIESDNALDLADNITDKILGVLQNAPNTGQEANVKVNNMTKVVSKEALAVGDYVGPATDGKAQIAVASQYACGFVTKATGAEDDLAEIELFRTADDLQGAETLQSLTVTGVVTLASALMTFPDAVNIVCHTTSGTKFGTDPSQKIGLWDATPVVQPTHNADPTAQAAMTGADPGAPTGVVIGDTNSVQNTGWGATAEADADKIHTNIDALVVDVAALRVSVLALIADVGELDGAVDNNKAAIDALNADAAATGLSAAS